MNTETTAHLRLAGLTAPQARELRSVAHRGGGTGVVGSWVVMRRLRGDLGLVEWTGGALGDQRLTEAGLEALRVLDGGQAYVDERNRRVLAEAAAQRHADGTTLRHAALAAGDLELYRELEANPRPATDDELRDAAANARHRAAAESRGGRGHSAIRRALACEAEADAIDAILAERAQARAADLMDLVDATLDDEADPDDDAADMATPAAGRRYARGAVHLYLDDPTVGVGALCGLRVHGSIATEAPLSCPDCRRADARIDAHVESVLAARRQAEADPTPALPGVDAAIVEAELGAGLTTLLPVAQAADVVEDLALELELAALDVARPAELTLIVVPCSGLKLTAAAPAGELYLGSLHTAARSAAAHLEATLTRTGRPARVVVLSALYGLLELDQVVEPYDVTIGARDAVTAARVAAQLRTAGATRVVALTPGRYTAHLAAAAVAAGARIAAPLAGSRGIGEQRGRLAAIRRGELAPV